MKFFTTPNSKNIIATLCIVTIEKAELTFLLILYSHDSTKTNKSCYENNPFPEHFGLKEDNLHIPQELGDFPRKILLELSNASALILGLLITW